MIIVFLLGSTAADIWCLVLALRKCLDGKSSPITLVALTIWVNRWATVFGLPGHLLWCLFLLWRSYFSWGCHSQGRNCLKLAYHLYAAPRFDSIARWQVPQYIVAAIRSSSGKAWADQTICILLLFLQLNDFGWVAVAGIVDLVIRAVETIAATLLPHQVEVLGVHLVFDQRFFDFALFDPAHQTVLFDYLRHPWVHFRAHHVPTAWHLTLNILFFLLRGFGPWCLIQILFSHDWFGNHVGTKIFWIVWECSSCLLLELLPALPATAHSLTGLQRRLPFDQQRITVLLSDAR